MNNQNKTEIVNTLERKKFFVNLVKSFMGLFLVSSFPFKIFGMNNSSQKKIEIKINPLAVSRDKDSKKNV
ncbi:MAG TPA: hypothetical protein VLN45_00675 [Ignavibacteriaceae bacterium]|nr:hypothetical protein [Ignavibacteriaceae bacterium]